jgi:hypothetical protein
VVLVAATVRTALEFMKDPKAPTAVSAPIARLMEDVHRRQRGWYKLGAAMLLAALLVGVSAGAWMYAGTWSEPRGNPRDSGMSPSSPSSGEGSESGAMTQGCH